MDILYMYLIGIDVREGNSEWVVDGSLTCWLAFCPLGELDVRFGALQGRGLQIGLQRAAQRTGGNVGVVDVAGSGEIITINIHVFAFEKKTSTHDHSTARILGLCTVVRITYKLCCAVFGCMRVSHTHLMLCNTGVAKHCVLYLSIQLCE